MGPMTAGLRFVGGLVDAGTLTSVTRLEVELFGSLAATGRGHRTDVAVQVGLAGFNPATVGARAIDEVVDAIAANRRMMLAGQHEIAFDAGADIVFRPEIKLYAHPNALRFTALYGPQQVLEQRTYYSVGGGFVLDEGEIDAPVSATETRVPFAFRSGDELLALADRAELTVAELMRANERASRSDAEIDDKLDRLWDRMRACVEHGLQAEGILPGGLLVPRRARRIYDQLRQDPMRMITDPLAAMDFVNVWALAVNEENAAGGAMVTAPTNGAAGIIPSVLMYLVSFRGGDSSAVRTFLLAAGAIGALYKRNASISGAEVGCQGEVGVACSMAAAGLTAALGGSNAQVENAAEIGMEHNLGLTCDPIGGLVQIPCIERNAMGAIKAIDASRLALAGDGSHHVSLDKVIATMKRTGYDMSEIYKETSLGGLAVNMVEC